MNHQKSAENEWQYNLSKKWGLTAYDIWGVISQLSSVLTFILIVPQIAIPAAYRHRNTYSL